MGIRPISRCTTIAEIRVDCYGFFKQVNEEVYGVEDEGLTTSDEQVAIPESTVRLTPEHNALLQQC